MNILIVRTQEQGYKLIEAMGGDRAKWQVISYMGPMLAYKPDLLVIIRPDGDSFTHAENDVMERWFREDVPHLVARADKVVEIG